MTNILAWIVYLIILRLGWKNRGYEESKMILCFYPFVLILAIFAGHNLIIFTAAYLVGWYIFRYWNP